MPSCSSLPRGPYYLSESDALLEPDSYPPVPGPLPSPALLQVLGEPADAPVAVYALNDFLRHHTDPAGILADPALAARYRALQAFLERQLTAAHVY